MSVENICIQQKKGARLIFHCIQEDNQSNFEAYIQRSEEYNNIWIVYIMKQ